MFVLWFTKEKCKYLVGSPIVFVVYSVRRYLFYCCFIIYPPYVPVSVYIRCCRHYLFILALRKQNNAMFIPKYKPFYVNCNCVAVNWSLRWYNQIWHHYIIHKWIQFMLGLNVGLCWRIIIEGAGRCWKCVNSWHCHLCP